ncbi:MAG: 2,3-bisphosphoglycerate-independent phosphoglycerate mutase [Desulfurococcales archaeon]|nr:2,3-bisphosphoglycerate-independent phosphoglycerate mutase [Desulfurococcales archaeon]
MFRLRLVYLVLDGAADRLRDEVTSYAQARKSFLNLLARAGKCGMMYTVGEGVAPESDEAVLSILGYDPHKYYTGRGPIEAVGAGINFRERWEVAFRANFATVDPRTGRLLDRRVGRSLSTEEAAELAKALDGLTLESHGGYVKFRSTVGHRAVAVLGSKETPLSPHVENVDPAYRRSGLISIAVKEFEPRIRECVPLDSSKEARITAELVNEFVRKAIEILDEHPVNKERERKGLLKANAVLLRDAGNELPPTPKVREKYGLTFGSVTEMPVEKGIAKILGMISKEMPPPSDDKEKNYSDRVEATLNLLERADVVYVHLKGPDEPGHDGDLEGKVRSIELIDQYYVKPLLSSIDLSEVALLITSDHATPPSVRAHTDDPVPVVVVGGDIEPDSVLTLTEKCCSEGSLGIYQHGWEVLPEILHLLGLKKDGVL